VAARQLTLRVPTHKTFPPLISLSGHNPIQAKFSEIGADFPEQDLRDADVNAGNLS